MKNNGYMFLPLLYSIYLTIDLLSMGFCYKFVQIGPFFMAAEGLVFPITYTIADIIAEVYGYNEAKKTIWTIFLCNFIFALGAFILCLVQSVDFSQQETYNYVFKSLLRGTVAEVVGVQASAFINIYIISKLKIHLKGKYFGIRCILSSAIGQALLVIISMPIIFLGHVHLHELFKIMVSSYAYKIIYILIMATPASLLASFLKRKEKVDIYDYRVNYNPFSIFENNQTSVNNMEKNL
jgi:uncharacterized integral membrane protein (TIGR00697 family)